MDGWMDEWMGGQRMGGQRMGGRMDGCRIRLQNQSHEAKMRDSCHSSVLPGTINCSAWAQAVLWCVTLSILSGPDEKPGS